MIVHTPFASELCFAPELAILAALEATAATTIEVMHAAHPEIEQADTDLAELPLDVAAAAQLSRQATDLIASLNRYRLSLLHPDWPF